MSLWSGPEAQHQKFRNDSQLTSGAIGMGFTLSLTAASPVIQTFRLQISLLPMHLKLELGILDHSKAVAKLLIIFKYVYFIQHNHYYNSKLKNNKPETILCYDLCKCYTVSLYWNVFPNIMAILT